MNSTSRYLLVQSHGNYYEMLCKMINDGCWLQQVKRWQWWCDVKYRFVFCSSNVFLSSKHWESVVAHTFTRCRHSAERDCYGLSSREVRRCLSKSYRRRRQVCCFICAENLEDCYGVVWFMIYLYLRCIIVSLEKSKPLGFPVVLWRYRLSDRKDIQLIQWLFSKSLLCESTGLPGLSWIRGP